MTMKELAKLCNVSVSTVSKAFNGANDVSEETKNQIFKVAKENSCLNKFYKEKYDKKVIAVILPEIAGNYYIKYAEILAEKIKRENCVCLVTSCDFSPEKHEELVEYFCDFCKVDGIITFHFRGTKKDYKTPIISLYSATDENIDTIKINDGNAFKKAMNLLLNHGHKHIAFFTEPLTKSRARKFTEIAKELNHSDIYVINTDKRFEKAGEDCVRKLPKEVTAIICAYDKIAFGAIKALEKRGLRVPDDISVIGVDNITETEYISSTLTTIGLDIEKLCSMAWLLLKKKIRSPYYKNRTIPTIEAELFIRESVAKNPCR